MGLMYFKYFIIWIIDNKLFVLLLLKIVFDGINFVKNGGGYEFNM